MPVDDVMTPHEFGLALLRCEPGEQVIYYSGHLFAAIGSRKDKAVQYALQRLRDAAWEACEAGRAELIQRRRPDAGFDYLAVRRKSILPIKKSRRLEEARA